ncbi:hypothetical protein HOLleu_36041 [Holothuria leucospilota]|uniref:Uncharacterized protein n=1 Tax=Holothuria leucospilota TaxID=206669 RepID=A0A9Q1BFF9_HOLLE|nr:hypothetical protein HOLleu_36041 [Holothuria leucospilota]
MSPPRTARALVSPSTLQNFSPGLSFDISIISTSRPIQVTTLLQSISRHDAYR